IFSRDWSSDVCSSDLDAGVDVISHGFYLNDELAQRMVEQGVYLDPTLSSYGRQTINPALKRGEAWTELHMPLIPAMEDGFKAARSEERRVAREQERRV